MAATDDDHVEVFGAGSLRAVLLAMDHFPMELGLGWWRLNAN
jgi:hypothetical protein